jgi:predicted dehydrogenase
MKRYALVGTGSRALDMFALPLSRELADVGRLVGVYDINPLRAAAVATAAGNVRRFDDFDEMLRTTRPDSVIVCTKDGAHHEYIIRALEAGCDVISEKPMTIDAAHCRRILDTEKRTGGKITVIFNRRSHPFVERIRELLVRGDIGTILAVDFEWLLDTRHGADYFRRWHRRLDASGGLLVHKATHHFDMVNWWLGEDPVTVFAAGSRRFYGDDRRPHGERCSACDYASDCEFFLDLKADPLMVALYLETESVDGYWRDRCVFDADIDIMDSMSVSVRYSGGALLTYSLVAHSPWEGWRISLSGTEGRLEAEEFSSGPHAHVDHDKIRVYDRNGGHALYRIARTEGTHGGADERLRRMIFRGEGADPLGRLASSRAGAMSLLIGVAANRSIATGQPVSVPELLGGAAG